MTRKAAAGKKRARRNPPAKAFAPAKIEDLARRSGYKSAIAAAGARFKVSEAELRRRGPLPAAEQRELAKWLNTRAPFGPHTRRPRAPEDTRQYALFNPAAKKKAASKKAASKKAPRKRKRNPSSAAEMFEAFHQRPAERHDRVTISEKHPSEVADCGELLKLEVYIDGDRRASDIEGRGNVRVWTTPDGGQLYFGAGDQSINLRAIGLGDYLPKDHIEIGPVKKIWYRTDKGFHNFEDVRYHHRFGEDGGVMPTLNYDTRNKRMYLTGGTYQVKREGIIN